MQLSQRDEQAWRRHKTQAEEVRALLVKRFPRCFAPKGAPKLPLKIGIYRDLCAACPDLTHRKIHRAIRDYTTGLTYLRALRSGADRLDLDGWPVGTVSPEQAEGARIRLKAKERRMLRKEQDHGQDRAA